MKKPVKIIVISILVIVILFFTYKAYLVNKILSQMTNDQKAPGAFGRLFKLNISTLKEAASKDKAEMIGAIGGYLGVLSVR